MKAILVSLEPELEWDGVRGWMEKIGLLWRDRRQVRSGD